MEIHLNRAVDEIEWFKKTYKREIDKKDEAIGTLQKKLDAALNECHDQKRLHEKENRELLSSNQILKHELSIEQGENERLKEELNRLQQNLASQDNRVLHLEHENEKANHIIKNLLRKLQTKTIPTQPSHLHYTAKV